MEGGKLFFKELKCEVISHEISVGIARAFNKVTVVIQCEGRSQRGLRNQKTIWERQFGEENYEFC